MMDLVQRLIAQEEGSSPHAYKDTRGYWTIGIGCLVDASVPSDGLCQAAIDAQFAHDSARGRSWAADLPGYQRLNEVQQAVLISMCFQLGDLHDWPQFKGALAVGDMVAASQAGLDSHWAIETPARAQREMKMLRSGVWVDQ